MKGPQAQEQEQKKISRTEDDENRHKNMEHTFDASPREYPLEIIDCAKEDLDVKDELFGHADGVEVGAVADLAEHVGDACST
jgi:hypothetical protein